MRYLFTTILCIGFICASYGQSCTIDGVMHSTFEDVQNILNANNCNSCHAGTNNQSNWNYDTYDLFLSSGSCNKKLIVHGDASNSYFYRKLGSGSNECGEDEDNVHNVTDEELNQIESWINFGAPEYCISLYDEVRQVLDANSCNSCHGANAQSWRYDTYVNMIDNDLDVNCQDQSVIVKGNSSQSLLYDKINNDGFVECGEEMNSEYGAMSYEDMAKIRDWINNGAYETAASLPVVLNSFNVMEVSAGVQIRWSTESEIATDKFEIERSRTGQNFVSILEVKSEGSSSLGADYQGVDIQPLIGDNYYRLKIIDLDGTFTYSNIRLIRVKSGETLVTVFPNPAVGSERLTVRWLPQLDEETTYLSIVDVNGQNLSRRIIFEGTNYIRLPELLDGVYYIIVEDLFGGFILERVVIIN